MKYIAVFLVTTILLAGILVLSAEIPRDAIQQNVQESAEYLCEGELFGTLVEGVNGSRIDRYADSILLAIAYQYDSEQPLRSVMWSSYYYTEYQNENKNLLDAVTYGYEPNQQYLRYWHGSNAIVRPLLLVFNVQQIYRLNGIVLTVLIMVLLAILLRNRAYVPAVGVAAGLVVTGFWYVPFSLEYTWTFLLMLLLSITGVTLAFRGRDDLTGFFFLIGGMVTNYVDFLTTETLTLLVPLLLIEWIHIHRSGKEPLLQHFKRAGKAALAWGCGYGGMWVMKWIMASAVLGENVMPYVSEHIAERLGGTMGDGRLRYVAGALLKNIKCLFPWEYGAAGIFAGIGLTLVVLYLWYVYRKKHICKEYIGLYLLPGLVPYIRYLVLYNHSYLHYFFTYRAQMATILALVLVLGEGIEWRWLMHADVRKRKS